MRVTGAAKGDRVGFAAPPLLVAAGSAAIAVALAASNLLHRPDFFLNDDYRTYFIPVFGEISRLVRHGELPFVTDRLWHGGAFLGEAQTGILNPVCLALIVLVGMMNNFAAAAAIYSLAHIAIFSLGTFFLCRALGCTARQAFLASIVAPTSEWTIYWGASNWVGYLVSIAWFPWAWAAIIKSVRDSRWCVPAAIFVYLMIASGNPFADLVFAISVTVAALVNRKSLHPRDVMGPLASVIGGGLLSLPAVLPLAGYLEITGRSLEAPRLQADLVALLGAGVPFMLTRWKAFTESYDVVFMPMIGVCWYVMPVLFNAAWKELWQRPVVRSLVIATAALALLSMGPGFWQFRWMFRLLQYYQLGLVLLCAVILSERHGETRPWNLDVTVLSLAIPIWVAIWQSPPQASPFILLGAAILALGFLVWWMREEGREGFTAVALAGHIVFFAAVGAAYCSLARFPNSWQPPTHRVAGSDPPLTRYEIFPLPEKDPNPSRAFWLFYRPGNTNLERPGISINGYSPLVLKSFLEHFCFMHLGATSCSDIIEGIKRPIPPMGLTALELMRVEEVRIADRAKAEQFARASRNWMRADSQDQGEIFHRSQPYALAAPVAWITPGATVTVKDSTASKVALSMATPASGPVTIVLARAWYPGWSATAGGRDLPVRSIAGLVTAVDLPAGLSGPIEISYWPKGLTLGIAGALLGLVLLAIAFRFNVPRGPEISTSARP